jgi:hypothetical protein
MDARPGDSQLECSEIWRSRYVELKARCIGSGQLGNTLAVSADGSAYNI